VEQHAEPIDHRGTALLGLDQELGFEWGVDEVVAQRARVQAVQGDVEVLLAGHAERGGVDDCHGVIHQVRGLCPVVDVDLGAEILADCVGAGAGAVGKADFGDTDLDQGGDNGPGGATGPKHHGGAGCGFPVGRVLAQVGDEARPVGVVGVDLAVLAEDQRVGCPDQCRPVGDHVGDLEDGLLVRDGDVAADEAEFREGAEEAGEVDGGDVDRNVVALYAVALQPVAVQRRAAAVGDGVAEDGGKRDAGMVGHVAIMPRLPIHANSGRSGRPRMVKWSPWMAEKRRTPSSSTL
jgi:hypothetical protein